jgi:hypothetical protein
VSTAPRRDDSGDRASRHERSERGFVLVLVALLILPLLAFTGLAVDLGAWFGRAAALQQASDAAALAGVVHMPDFTRAETAARQVAMANGFVDGADGISITVSPVSGNSSQLRVTVRDDGADQFFSGPFTGGAVDISRTATAEYVKPVPMGSPDSELGNDPADPDPPQFWLNIAGRGTNKSAGDRNATTVCNSGTWGCNGTTNAEFVPDGYIFKVSVGALQPGRALVIDAFDPAFTNVGDYCENGNLNGLTGRYAPGDTPHCTGDNNVNGANIETTFIVRGPDSTPLDSTDNPPICAISFGPNNAQVGPLLANTANRAPENVPFSAHFRRWFGLCTVPAGQVQRGDYFVQVKTNANTTSRGATPRTAATTGLDIGTLGEAGNIDTAGHNRYALRAGFVDNPAADRQARGLVDGAGVGLSANGRLPIYVNVTATTTEFYLARITPEYAGKTLLLSFWDIADGAGSATVTVVPPSDAVAPPTTCTFSRDGTANMGGATVTGCTASNMTTGSYNNRITQVTMPMPSGYSCTVENPDSCWFKVRLSTTGGRTNDTTTWSANVIGDPVRLVAND